MAKRGTTKMTADKFMRKSKMSRRGGNVNPNRQRQPKRMGSGPMMDAKAKSASNQLRGPDKGMG